jgi:pyridoxal phosphate enzyme (YggS family)
MSTIAANLQDIRRRISEALQGDRREVRIVAVSKSQPLSKIREAHAAGCGDFGENYVREAIAKIDELGDIRATWHFIGQVQTNKAREVAERFDWVHGIDRPRAAAALSRARPAGREPLNVCLQVNISAEATKGGVPPGDVAALAREVHGLPGLRLRGLMGMASAVGDAAAQRAQFALLRQGLDTLRAQGIEADTLSMGMSDDSEAAIAEGATMVRIGTVIFGERQNRGQTPIS